MPLKDHGRGVFTLFLLTAMFSPACLYAQEVKHADVQSFTAFHMDAGYNRSGFLSAGISKVRWFNKGVMGASDCRYAAAEANLGNYKGRVRPFAGVKLGYENAWGGFFCGALEARLLSDFNYAMPLLTPKAGISLYNAVSLLYGYRFFDEARNPFRISHHQISLSLNLNRQMLKK